MEFPSELFFRPTLPAFQTNRREAEAKRKNFKESEKISARTLFWPEAGFSVLFCFYLLSTILY